MTSPSETIDRLVATLLEGTSAAELRVLKATPASDARPCGPNGIGLEAWPAIRVSGACSAPYARPAGRVLNRLRARGLVERSGPMSWWRRTRAGDLVAKSG